MVFVHNYPYGDTSSSHSDIELTRRLVHGGSIMVIDFLDCIILCYDYFLNAKKRKLT